MEPCRRLCLETIASSYVRHQPHELQEFPTRLRATQQPHRLGPAPQGGAPRVAPGRVASTGRRKWSPAARTQSWRPSFSSRPGQQRCAAQRRPPARFPSMMGSPTIETLKPCTPDKSNGATPGSRSRCRRRRQRVGARAALVRQYCGGCACGTEPGMALGRAGRRHRQQGRARWAVLGNTAQAARPQPRPAWALRCGPAAGVGRLRPALARYVPGRARGACGRPQARAPAGAGGMVGEDAGRTA
jgi:hypothetical protein